MSDVETTCSRCGGISNRTDAYSIDQGRSNEKDQWVRQVMAARGMKSFNELQNPNMGKRFMNFCYYTCSSCGFVDSIIIPSNDYPLYGEGGLWEEEQI